VELDSCRAEEDEAFGYDKVAAANSDVEMIVGNAADGNNYEGDEELDPSDEGDPDSSDSDDLHIPMRGRQGSSKVKTPGYYRNIMQIKDSLGKPSVT
jgi:hypothetical protein